MAEYPRKKKYPERQFTSEDAMQHYFSTLQEEENDKRAMNIIHNMYLLSPGYAGSSEATYNANQISKGSTSTAGLATRYRLMNEADKERVAKEFTTIFQAKDFPDMETFYRWTKTMGPWYNETLLRQHEAITKNRVDAMKSTKVAEAVDTLFGEYNDEWVTGSYAEQNKVRQNIADSDAIKNLPSKWRATAMDEVIKMFNSLLSPTGQYAADEWQMKKDKWTATQKKTEDDLEKERDATNRKNIARSGAYRLFEYMKAAEEAPGIGLGLSFNDAKDKVTEEMEGTVWDRKEFDDVVKTLRREDAPTPPGTKPVYDPATDSTIFATDAEIAADDSLVPTAAESNLDPDTARIGALMAVKGEMPNEVWKKYYKGGMDLLYNSLAGPDAEHIKKWLLQVEEYKAKTAAGVSINYQLLNPDSAGQATGQQTEGLSNPRLKTK